ncbi:MAG TPA: DUF5713 family protein [Chitinophagaceae bacterium]|nr:DUF5713 family protein [Chitinophagaceae bacterium]
MSVAKLPADFEFLKDMYEDGYFPNFLVDKVKSIIQETVSYIEEGNHSTEDIQTSFDEMTLKINALQDEFEENDSEIESVARDSIGTTVESILTYFNIDIDTEEAIRERDW